MLSLRSKDAPGVPRQRTMPPEWRRVARTARRRSGVADLAYIVLSTSLWLAGNLLGVLGCAVAVFVVISHGHIDTFFLHVDNLAARYVAADLGRRAVFAHQLVELFVIVFAVTMLLRGPAFVARLRRDLAEKVA